MSSNKNIYEVFDDFKAAKTKEERINVLRSNDTYVLRNILLGALHPEIQFTVEKIPEYKSEAVPAGLAYNNMTDALSRVYLFTKGNSKVPPALTEKRKTEILIQILESLEAQEANVFAGMLMKNLKVPHLTVKLVNEAIPGILPE